MFKSSTLDLCCYGITSEITVCSLFDFSIIFSIVFSGFVRFYLYVMMTFNKFDEFSFFFRLHKITFRKDCAGLYVHKRHDRKLWCVLPSSGHKINTFPVKLSILCCKHARNCTQKEKKQGILL